MKKCLKEETTPFLLAQYQADNPNATWKQFKNESDGYEKVQEQLQIDQGNLCCYCEIDTKQGLGVGKDDFRVEHFHPKSDDSNINHNWALDWENMLGCCCGGSERYVTNRKERFIQVHAERHSDVLKDNHIWDNEILNPLEIPAFPILFKTNRKDGSLSVLENNCSDADISIEKSYNCLDSKKLNLNSKKLKSFRKTTLDTLNDHILEQMSKGLTIEEAMMNMAKAQLIKNKDAHWSAFFTSIRGYLGSIAEEHLKTINYNG